MATDSGAGEGEEEEDDEDEKEHEAVDDEGEGNDENDVSDDEEEGENDDEEDDKSIGDESGEDEDDNEEDGGDADGDADDEHVQEEEEDLEEYEWMGVEETENNEVTESVKSPRQKLKKNQDTHAAGDNSEEYGVSRGIDFQDVNFVINFDFPTSAANYTHRIGRTARGSRVGTALSLISVGPSKNTHSYKPLSKKEQLNAKIASRDWRVLQEVRHSQPKLGFLENDNILAAIQTPDMTSHGGGRGSVEIDESKMQPLPLNFNMKELDAFRYRVEDTLRSVTSVAVKELRAAEIKREILNSSKLKSYFSENPNDLTVSLHTCIIRFSLFTCYNRPCILLGVETRQVNSSSHKAKATSKKCTIVSHS